MVEMGAYKYIQDTFRKEYAAKSPEYKARLIAIRKEPVITKLDKPTNIPRARELGYKAKQGFVVARVRVTRGSGLHRHPVKGRRPKRMGTNKLTRKKSKQVLAEEKAQRKYTNLEVLNSYWICEDGQHKWFEVLLVDPKHPSIANDGDVSWITSKKHTKRANRGKTSSQRKGRGLNKKGTGTEKTRPGRRARGRKGR
jgi:large subunit ribosomal protein L15e